MQEKQNKRCEYCWQPAVHGGHNIGCPILHGTPEAMARWQRGCDYGFGDNFLTWYQLEYHSLQFQHGYRVGKAENDEGRDESSCPFQY